MPGSANRASTSMSNLPRCVREYQGRGPGYTRARGAAAPRRTRLHVSTVGTGVWQTYNVGNPLQAEPVTLRERLATQYPASSRRTVKQWLAAGRITVNGQIVRRGDVTVAAGDRVSLGAPAPPGFSTPLRLVHEDADILVVDKPPGLLTIATERERERTAYRLLTDYVRARDGRRLFIVRRLDRETSGLVVFARSAGAKQALQEQFAGRRVERVYMAVVEGRIRDETGTLKSRLVEDGALRVRPASRAGSGRGKSREAITHYTVLARGRDATLLE